MIILILIMKTFLSLKQNKVAFSLSIIVAVFFVVSIASAVTTITTNIDTAGTLNVSGLSTLANASSTLFSSSGNFMVNGYATTTASNGNIATAGSLTVGSTSQAVTQILNGTCNLSTTVARTALSTSSLPFQCAVANAVSGDRVFVSLQSDGGSQTSVVGLGGIVVNYAIASTTATGFIQVGLSNWSGAATSSYTLATSSAQYWIVR